MSASLLQSSITADEVVAPGTVIELAFAAPVDAQSAQAAIRVMRGCEPLRVAVELAKRGRVVTVRLDEATVGACQLVITELLGTKGERLVERHRIAFSVLPISGKLPDNLRVEHAVRLFIDELEVIRLAPGEKRSEGHVDVVKAVHRGKGTPVELAFDERGARVDIARRLAALAERRAARFGRIDETLFQRIEKAKDERARRHRRLATDRAPGGAVREARRPALARAARGREESGGGVAQVVGRAAHCAAGREDRSCARREQRRRGAMRSRERDGGADPSPRSEQGDRRDPFRRPERDQRSRRFDRRRPLRPCPSRGLHRHRRPRRGLGRRAERHDQPLLRRPLHDLADGQRRTPG